VVVEVGFTVVLPDKPETPDTPKTESILTLVFSSPVTSQDKVTRSPEDIEAGLAVKLLMTGVMQSGRMDTVVSKLQKRISVAFERSTLNKASPRLCLAVKERVLVSCPVKDNSISPGVSAPWSYWTFSGS
jgi:hypothetical protein